MQVDLELFNFLNQFQDVFIDDIPRELPPKRGDDDHMIELIPGSSPPNKPPYRVSQAQQEEIMRQVNELVEKGMVRPSSSPFCSPVLLVQKKDGTYHICVDYRALNRITINDRFPVPRVEDLFDKLQGSTYFSRIELKSGYHQIRIVDEDIVKTAFRTTFGLYEYLVMPFGLTNAPSTFNRMMERIFRPHRNFTGVFFDDVIIYSKTIEEHKEHLKVIFQALRDNKLYVYQKKSEFFLQEIQYLGHIISKNGIRMDPAKLEVIKDWPNPRNLHEVRNFIGMCAYYIRFIEKFSLIAGPLYDLTKKNVKYVWTEKRQQAFDTLKKKLISQPVLVLPDLSKPFEVQCDACGDCLGAVLLQEGHAIAYEISYSIRQLNSVEKNYTTIEREGLGMIYAVKKFRHYLLSKNLQQTEVLSKGKEAVGSLASTSQIHQAETHLHIQPPLMPEMPEFQGTQEKEQSRPVPGALDIREQIEQEVEDMPEGLAKEYLLYEKKVMELVALAFLQPDEQIKDFGHDFLPLPLMRHKAILWKEKMRPAVPQNEEGGYEGIPLTTEEAQTLIKDHPRWRKKWLNERPRDFTNFHNTPQALQIDPTYCSVPRRRSWADFQKWKGRNKTLLNYPASQPRNHQQ
ncbi:hypothetical protein L7F22_034783 [Adiantum nelumboides]|nr:hypothetical protein [Adiantum nelumboides]